ncbi:MAG: M28 family peptidase [Chloroflexi bacterium]|nr:M28 family peptidase [Chloroflexota bacterium]MDA1228712.1 M28 family peptidase [Chloroflexota bacterium]
MDESKQRALTILENLAGQAATSFFEDRPTRFIVETLAKLDGVESRRDQFGNVIAHYRRLSPDAAPRPPIAFVAHMDHPGFEIYSNGADEGLYTARAMGGVPVASLNKPVPVLVLTPDGKRLPATLEPMDQSSAKDGDRLVGVRLESDAEFPMPAAVIFDLSDFSLDGDIIRMRAADDLAGCASILAALGRLAADKAETDFYAVFTRAEEGGLYGARLMAEAGTLPKETLVVSVETSSIIPGVTQGEGPVVRTGDRVYTFDADAEQVFHVARASILKRIPEFKSQRQLMSAGGCEATAFAVFGYKVTGLAYPLGNWHNATTSIPDPDGGVDSEYISLSDYLGGVELIAEAAISVAQRNDSATRQRIRDIPEDVRRRMLGTAEG